MIYFIRDGNDNVLCDTGWIFENNCAHPLADQNHSITATPKTLIKTLKSGAVSAQYQIGASTLCTLVPSKVPCRQFHPRIFRPVLGLSGPPLDNVILTNAKNQLTILSEMLARIARTIYPKSKDDGHGNEVGNLTVYGHDIRNGLLLACTEIEAQLKGVLQANDISSIGRNYTTKDYVKLCEALDLKSYEIDFYEYPSLNNRRPFDSWESENPTKSLPWYAAYNAVKHDRESQFHRARFEYLIDSIAAMAVLLHAQFGIEKFGHTNLSFVKSPVWCLDEYYIAPFSQRHPEGGVCETAKAHRERAESLWLKVNITV